MLISALERQSIAPGKPPGQNQSRPAQRGPMIDKIFATRLASIASAGLLSLSTLLTAQPAQHYKQTSLVSDLPARTPRPNLVNPWGMSRSSGSPWWISDNGTGRSTLYTGTGADAALVVTIPRRRQQSPPAPRPAQSSTAAPASPSPRQARDLHLRDRRRHRLRLESRRYPHHRQDHGQRTLTRSVFKGVAMATVNLSTGQRQPSSMLPTSARAASRSTTPTSIKSRRRGCLRG